MVDEINDAFSALNVGSISQRLGIIFDIDGTLIAESKRINGVRVRPGAVDFIRWCKFRGHSVALWTKAHTGWAHHVALKICPLVHPDHKCTGSACRATFDFVWDGDKMTRQRQPSVKWQSQVMCSSVTTGQKCRWCEVYSSRCAQCECQLNYTCPCREVKDLRKIWYSQEEETKNFVKEKTVILENTPQNCIYNYGNAIYVPTYTGTLNGDDVFEKMQSYFAKELEPCENVRKLQKCQHGQHYHACYEQSYLTKY